MRRSPGFPTHNYDSRNYPEVPISHRMYLATNAAKRIHPASSMPITATNKDT